MTMYQAGMEFKLPRAGANGAPEDGGGPAPFTAEELRAYAGTYHFEKANQDWRVQIDRGRLAVDVPGQTVYALKWPDNEGKWAFALSDAIKVSFEKDEGGKINQLTCYQAGMTIPMQKTGAAEGADLPTVDEIMAKRAAQSEPGTAAALGVIRTEGTMRFVQQGVSGRVTSLSDSGGRFRFDIDLGTFGAIRMGSDGESTWSETLGMPVEEVTGDKAADLRRQATEMFVKDLRREFQIVEVARRDTLNGAPVIVLRARSADGKRSVTEYVDPESGLPLKETGSTTVPGLGPVPKSSEFTDYRDFEGLKIPTRVTIESMGSGLAVLTIESVKTHVEATPSDFVRKREGR
jgi:hypothetical protein